MNRFLLALLVLAAMAMPALAQSSTGNLVGTVSDPSGVVAGATVVVKDSAGKERTVVSSGDGAFSVTQLEPGLYTVSITAPGHKSFTATELKIDVGRDYTLNRVLDVGGVNENVSVVAGADIVNSSNGDLSSSVSPKQIQELPLDGRSPLSLIPLQAGTAKASPGSVTSINGQRTAFTNLTRDGINVNDNFIRANGTDFSPERASSDDTGEFTITTQNAGAEQGYGAAQVQLVTPRGTSEYHGALYEYNRNSYFSANTFNGNASGSKRAYLNRNQFGGKIGGPIPFTGKKMFVFFDYERQFLRQSQTNTSTVLTAAARAGTFTFVDSTNTRRTVNIFSLPATAPVFGPVAPTSINPVVQSRLLAPMPLPNTSGGGLNTGAFSINQGFNDDYKYYTGRVDYDINQKNTINVIYTNKREDLQRPDITFDSFTNIPPVTQPGINKFAKLGWVSTISNNLTNEVGGGFSFPTASFNLITPVPSFYLTSTLTNLPETTFRNQGRTQHNYNLSDTLTWTKGAHTFRFGETLQFFRIKPYNDAGISPSFALGVSSNSPQLTAASFTGILPAGATISSTSVNTANSLLGLLGGIISGGSQTFNPTDPTSPLSAQTLRQFYAYDNYASFVSDQWRVRPGLTVNFGLRYEIWTGLRLTNGIALEPIISGSGVSSILDPNGAYQIIGGNSGGNNRFYKDDKNNFSPIVSVAWSPEFKNKFLNAVLPGQGKSVVRGGFRISYVPDQFLTSARNANGNNIGLGSTSIGALQNGSALLNLRPDGALPTINAPSAPTFPKTYLSNNGSAFLNFGTVFGVDPNLQTGRTQEYSIGIQRELGFKSALEVRYVGSYSNNLIRVADYNQVEIVKNGFLTDFLKAQANLKLTGNAFCATSGCQTLSVFGSATTAPLRVAPTTAATPAGTLALATFNSALNGGTPGQLALSFLNGNLDLNPNAATPQFPLLPNPNTGVADLLFNGAKYNYNSLQVEFRRRFSSGFYAQANYTFSKNLTNAIGTAQALTDTFLDNARPELDYARADFDQTHAFNLNGIYELPFGSGKRFLNQSGVVDRIFGGFQVSSIMRVGSGRPVTITDARGTFNRTVRSGRQTPNTNLTKAQLKNLFGSFVKDGVKYYINPSVLQVTKNSDGSVTSLATNGPGQPTFTGQAFFNVPAGQVGNMERAIFNGPTQFSMDFGLVKKIRLTERMRLELRGEAFNVLNHNNYLLPLLIDISSATFGQLTPGLSEQAGGFDSPRRLQFAVRFEF